MTKAEQKIQDIVKLLKSDPVWEADKTIDNIQSILDAPAEPKIRVVKAGTWWKWGACLALITGEDFEYMTSITSSHPTKGGYSKKEFLEEYQPHTLTADDLPKCSDCGGELKLRLGHMYDKYSVTCDTGGKHCSRTGLFNNEHDAVAKALTTSMNPIYKAIREEK